MNSWAKQLSNPFSTGGGGAVFETRVQAAFTVLMLTGGFSPCLPPWPIKKIKLQGKRAGYDTDDLIVFVEEPSSKRRAKLLAQVKHSIAITKRDRVFKEVIQAAWNDFNNVKLFNQGTDAISLITGPLSATDAEVRTILEWARHSEDAQDFARSVNQTNFSSKIKQTKLGVFGDCLREANGGLALSDDQLWGFLKHFHLLEVDLDIESGFTQSLIGSLVNQYAAGEETAIWSMVLNVVQTENQNEGTITRDSIPEELRLKFLHRAATSMPAELAEKHSRQSATDWSQKEFAADLGVAFLLGGWNDSTEGDLDAGATLSKKDVNQWTASIRRTLQDPDIPLALRNGTWSSSNRVEVWETLGKSIFDSELDDFHRVATDVLSERDPMFELASDARYMASIKGKVLTHSGTLRQGIVDTLAVMGGCPRFFVNCSDGKAETVALLVVREVLADADWVLWGSLNNLLPLLAEAAPNEFLSAVEQSLERDPCPFAKLFAEEGNGVMGSNYLTGLLWALETLAWDEEYLARVAVVLGELSVIDPGGNWSNRPINSLTTILLPWRPQTTASVEKRQTAVRTVVKEVPASAWPALLSLLPSQHQMSSGCHKPRWRQKVPDDGDKGVTKKEYWDQVSCYADLALKMAEGDTVRLGELVEALDTLPPPVFDKLLNHLESAAIRDLPEAERTSLWSVLVEFTARHRRYADADWALSTDLLQRIDKVTCTLAPETPLNRYLRLFSEKDLDLYEEDGNWEEQERKLNERREAAIREIHAIGGTADIIWLAKEAESAPRVGIAMGAVATEKDDATFFPELLSKQDEAIARFISAYVWTRRQLQGWEWVDQTVAADWPAQQLGQFLRSLPFCRETWFRVSKLLGKQESEYWSKVFFNSFRAQDDSETAVDKLLKHGRPNAAIDCLYAARRKNAPLDHARTVKALLAAVTTNETPRSRDIYCSLELIKALQNDPSTDPEDLFKIEWAYLRALDGHQGACPKLLEHRLASTPQFFCEVIRIIFRSRDEDAERREPTEREQNLASNAYRLLHEWRTPPGTLVDGSFSPSAFDAWLAEVKSTCKKTGHIEVALSQIGQALIYTPADPSGLWINETVADALNAKDGEGMRSGFRTGVFNSRGVHWVDPAGKPETEFAAKYKAQADSAEEAGYHRLASTMRSLSDSFTSESERIIAEHERDEDD